MKDYINHRPQITNKEKRDLLNKFSADLFMGFMTMFVIVSMALLVFGLEVQRWVKSIYAKLLKHIRYR